MRHSTPNDAEAKAGNKPSTPAAPPTRARLETASPRLSMGLAVRWPASRAQVPLQLPLELLLVVRGHLVRPPQAAH
jgi:hypothetical protein